MADQWSLVPATPRTVFAVPPGSDCGCHAKANCGCTSRQNGLAEMDGKQLLLLAGAGLAALLIAKYAYDNIHW